MQSQTEADTARGSNKNGIKMMFFIRLRRRFRFFMVRFKSDEKVINGAYRYFGIDKTYADLIGERIDKGTYSKDCG